MSSEVTKFFLRTALALASAVLISASCGGKNAPQTDTPRAPLKEYTKDNPAEWQGLEEEHYPRVSIDNKSTENVIIRVKFPIVHPPDHYIEKIGIMDKNGHDVMVKRFNPTADNIEARFILPFVGEGYRAYARCSLHDLWTAPLEGV